MTPLLIGLAIGAVAGFWIAALAAAAARKAPTPDPEWRDGNDD